MLLTRFKNDTLPEIGCDEAGRGPLWGPLVAAAVILPPEEDWTDAHRELAPLIQDSKKVTAKRREALVKRIEEFAIGVGIGFVTAEEIDNWGATRANQMAFRRALDNLYDKRGAADKQRVLLDGIIPLHTREERETIYTVVDGDAKYLSIAAASILAKVAHDSWVVKYCAEHVAEAAKYDLLNCKGYGTAKHREGILKYGYTELHRRLYLRKLIPDIVVSRYKIVEDS